jgi:Winged helix DNA-binding domain
MRPSVHPPIRITWVQACATRLTRHGLTEPVAPERLADQVAIMCGAHAQVMSAAELSIGLRVARVTRADVRDALWVDRSLIKTYGPRGTVHLLAAADLPMWTGALSVALERPRFPEGVRLTPDQQDRVVEAIDDALGERELTIDELGVEVVARTGAWAGERVMPAFQDLWPRWRQEIGTAANRGVLCFGPNRGPKVTYTSPRRWLPGFQPAPQAEALAGVLRRYLYAYGPATPQQFGRWLGVSSSWVARCFEALGDEAEAVDLDGMESWVLRTAETSGGEPRGVRLLPYFDAYTVGCYPREKVFPGRAFERALTGGQAGNVPVVLIDGVVRGVWHQRRSGSKVAITLEPFVELTAAKRREVDHQVARIGEILEAHASWATGDVTVGPHA